MKSVQLVTTKPDMGASTGGGIYPPCGLLTIASAMGKVLPDVHVTINDEQHEKIVFAHETNVVGIQVASTLCYEHALAIAEQAKAAGNIVVLGGPHVTAVYDRILEQRPFVDYLVRGRGEEAFVHLLMALQKDEDPRSVPAVSWRDRSGSIVHNDRVHSGWQYDCYTPLPFEQLSIGINGYWHAYQAAVDPKTDAAFLIFTHFGCGYREARLQSQIKRDLPLYGTEDRTPFCAYCALDDPLQIRDPTHILGEIRTYVDRFQIPKGARIHLRCYGDNIGPLRGLVLNLERAIAQCSWWHEYEFAWVFYCQSVYFSEALARSLKAIGTSHLYIGFDGVNDEIQRRSGLGTSRKAHERAVALCEQFGIRIQAGAVLGLMGETPESLEEMYQFFRSLRERDVLDRMNAGIIFIIPDTPVYELLAAREPQIRSLDDLPTEAIRALWLRHFAPQVTRDFLQEYAEKIDALSPGAHGQIGFETSKQ